MIVYEGDPDVNVSVAASIASGDICNVSRLEIGSHTGTHIDAPRHFIEGAPGVDEIPLNALVGPASVIDATALTTNIDRDALIQLGVRGPERIILKTRNSSLWSSQAFSADYVGLAEDGARYLVEIGARLVGIDYLSIAPASDPVPTHLALLGAGVVIVEGLDLREVEPGDYELVCLPLAVAGCDGAPARAMLLER
ncbi:MAG: cyclase family protein [Dehalococcoidia bacterium]|nr:cyclase family protein [Dehalococcoidia bacterium]